VRSCVHVDCDRPAHAKGMCLKHYKAAYRATNQERIAAYRAAWRAENLERTATYDAAYHAENRERHAAYYAAWQVTDVGKEARAKGTATYRATAHGKALRTAAWARRRALKAGVSIGEPFTNTAIFDRAGWVCGLCGLPVDRDLAWPNPASASLDHAIPLAKGGAHSMANVQLAHLKCNLSKGSRLTARRPT